MSLRYISMKQHTLAMAADQNFEHYRKPTRRDAFMTTMEAMEAIVPWAALCAALPKGGQWPPAHRS